MARKSAPLPQGVALNREGFLHGVVTDLVDMLETVVGPTDAKGFVAAVGQRLGETYEPIYRHGRRKLNRDQIVRAILAFETHVHGEFHVVSHDDERIVLGNHACPFGARVHGHPALCMLTSGVLGVFVAQNLGYARVQLAKTIAEGHPGCDIVIHLKPAAPGAVSDGREYFEV